MASAASTGTPDNTATSDAEQTLLQLFAASASAEEVVAAWLGALAPEARKAADEDPPTARSELRHTIVDARARSAAVRADAASGWKYTGAIIRAMDAALGVAPLKPSKLFGPKGVSLIAPKQIVAGVEVDPASPQQVVASKAPAPPAGTLALFWSGVEAASDAGMMLANGITHRLNVAAECQRAVGSSEGLVTATVPMEDLQHEQLGDDGAAALIWIEQLREVLALLRAWRDEAVAAGAGLAVNVNCKMGKNRSGAVVAAWLCLEHGWELLPAVEHLRQVSSLSLGNPHLNVAVAHIVGADHIDIPLLEADEGGNWVTYSPPGSPRGLGPDAGAGASGGGAAAAAEGAAQRLAAAAAAQGEGEEDAAAVDGLADLADLFAEM